MSKSNRRKFTSEFKAKVTLMAIKEQQPIEQICKHFDVHPSQVNAWKRQFLRDASSIFESASKQEPDDNKELLQTLYAKIGELNVANDYLKKKLC
jgi:transposase-like protein